jgi:branched-chain amino acid transport system substrate-binding protein
VRTHTARLLALAVAVLALATCTGRATKPLAPAAPAGKDVRVGVITSRSGPDAGVGVDALRGAQLAAELVDSVAESLPLPLVGRGGLPGLGGARLILVPADTGGNADRAAQQAARLAAQRVAGVVAAGSADVVAAASQRTERSQLPFVASDPPADFLTERGLNWFFRTGPTDRTLAAAGFSALLRLDPRARRVAVLSTDDTVSAPAVVIVKELAAEGGYTPVASAAVAAGAPPAGAVEQVHQAHPDALFIVAGTRSQAEQLLGAVAQRGDLPARVVGLGGGFTDPTVADAAAAAGVPLLRSAAWSALVAARNPAVQGVMDRYRQRYGATMSQPAADAFTAVLTLAQAIDAARSTDPPRVRAALLGLDVAGIDTVMPWDGVSFDATQQNANAGAVVEQVTPSVPGKVGIVFPGDLAGG